MTLDVVIFFVSAVVAVFGATMMIVQRNPVASVLFLILSLVAQAVCYVQLGALFVGSLLVIIYAGAIMVLFLFVIMLLNLRGGEDLGKQSSAVSRLTKALVAALLVIELLFVVKGVVLPTVPTGIMVQQTGDFGSVPAVAKLLFTKYMYPFQLTGVLLLIAVVGAVMVARKDRDDDHLEEAPHESAEVEVPTKAVK